MSNQRKPLAETFPELAKEAHGWDPYEIHDLTNIKMEWICSKGHIWKAFTYARTGKKATGCPVCANRVLVVGSNDLGSQFPELASQADGWNPQEFTIGSQKKVSWKCSKSHHWEATIANRVAGSGCPFCKNLKILKGFNDLATTHPEIAREADGWDPTAFTSGSSKKQNWKCKRNHSWAASISSRTGKSKTGCPFCWGRLVVEGETDLSTKFPSIAAEAYGWDPQKVAAGSHLKLTFKCSVGHIYLAKVGDRTRRNSGCSICTKKRVVEGINDLLTTHPELAKEADGWDPKKVVAGSNKKLDWKCAKGHSWRTSVAHRTERNQGCPYCLGRRVTPGENDLLSTHPELAQEANGWDPAKYSFGSNKKMSWICSKGHEWITSISHRAGNLKTGCPICSNQKLAIGVNDLATTHPNLATEADGWDPTTVIAGSNRKFRWICHKGHRWTARLISRSLLKTGCPVCQNLKISVGENDLSSTHPELAKEADGWNPKEVVAGSNKRMIWKCKQGHSWKASINHRAERNQGCPTCSNRVLHTGFNDIATTHPELAREALNWDPREFMAGYSARKLLWKCSFAHTWAATPASRTNTHHQSGCPSCAKAGFDPNRDGWLYFLSHPDWEMYQIGITNSPKNRLETHTRLGWEILEVRGPMKGDLARQWESDILRMLKNSGANLGNTKIAGKFTGYTESWLKQSFPVNSLKELIRLVHEKEK